MSELERRLPPEKLEAPAKKPYEKPEVVYEARLEVRAGSPLAPDPLDPHNPPFDLTGIFGP